MCSYAVYYDSQLSKAWKKIGDQALMLSLCCCHRQPASFPVATCQSLKSFGRKICKIAAYDIVTIGNKEI